MASEKVGAGSKKGKAMEEYVFAAIDLLKGRKARPDLPRIAYILNKRHGINVDITKATLEQMTDDHKIVRVDYKGSVSYRDLKNWTRVHDIIKDEAIYAGALILNSDRAGTALKSAIRSILTAKSASSASISDLEKYFREKGRNKYTSAPLSVALQREVNAGNLLQTGPDAFTIRKPKKAKQKVVQRPAPPAGPPVSEVSSTLKDATKNNGKRVKKTKVIFDPSDGSRAVPLAIGRSRTSSSSGDSAGDPEVASPPAKRAKKQTPAPPPTRPAPPPSRPAPQLQTKCNFCQNNEKHEIILVCRLCSTPAHPSCLGYSRSLAEVVKVRPWTCMDCKHCKICQRIGGEMIFCDRCDEAYHMRCHKPHVLEKPEGEWICASCPKDPVKPAPKDRIKPGPKGHVKVSPKGHVGPGRPPKKR